MSSASIHCLVWPRTTCLAFARAARSADPVRSIAALSSSLIIVSLSMTACADSAASLSTALATPAHVAPMATDAATCTPSRMPPEAISGRPHPLHSWSETGEGMPQSKNVSPMPVLTSSSTFMARYSSTAEKLVPPMPAMSMPRMPMPFSLSATSREIPAPVSLTMMGYSCASDLMASRTPLALVSPSGCTTS